MNGIKTSCLSRSWQVAAAGFLIVALGVFGNARAEESPGSLAEAVKDSPIIQHVPITSTVRGAPVNISAIINAAAGSTITSAVVLVRVTDVGTPMSVPMSGEKGEDNSYAASLPVAMFEQVQVFWYAIDVRDDFSRIGGTVWYRVVILNPIEQGGGSAKAGLTWKQGGAIAGGVALIAGAAVALEHYNDDGGSSKSGDIPPPSPPPPPPPANNNNNGGNVTPPPPPPTNPPPCVLTGNESASYENMTLYCDEVESGEDILILICFTCTNASISASATWGASDVITSFSNTSCSPTVPKLQLAKPAPNGFINPGDYTISVFVNGNLIDIQPWPPLSDQDCL